MEIPPGRMDRPAIRKLLETTCLVHKNRNMLDGIVNFKFNRSHNIMLKFICFSAQGRGIGTELLRNVAKLGVRNRAEWIYRRIKQGQEGHELLPHARLQAL